MDAQELESDLDPTPESNDSDSFSLTGVEGGVSRDSLRLIQEVSVKVTFLYFDLPPDPYVTLLGKEFRGALTSDPGPGPGPGPLFELRRDGAGTELERGDGEEMSEFELRELERSSSLL